MKPPKYTIDSFYRRIFNDYQRDSYRRGFTFNLTPEQLVGIVILDCHYCGQPPELAHLSGRDYLYCCNGIDRNENDIGYIPGNVVPCCKMCNKAKHVFGYDQFTQ